MKHIETDIAWLKNIPKHWKVDRLKDCCSKITGGGTPKSSTSEFWDDGNIIWVTPTDFSKTNSKFISDSVKKITELGLQKSSANKLPKGTVIMSSRASIGDVKIAETELTTNQGFVSYIPSYKLDNNFLYYLISCQLGEYFLNIASGTTFMEISRKMASLEYIPLPPKQEQIAIANYLDKACERIDEIIKIKEDQIKTNDSIKKSQVFKLCTQGINKGIKFKDVDGQYVKKIPSHWEFGKLKRGCKSIDTGGTPKSSESAYFIDGTIKWYAPDCFEDSMVLSKPKKLINRIALEKNEIKLYAENSIYFVAVGATAGKVGIIKEPSSCNQQINILKTNYKLHPEFLFYHLKIIEKEIIRFAQYTTLPILNQSKTGYIEICYPPLNEQLEIVNRLHIIFDNTRKTKNTLEEQIKTLKSYRKSLIHECVTGKKQIAKAIETIKN